MAKVYIGTSGWQYPHWRKVFYPPNLSQKEWLRYYTKYFDTVEVNATFYHQMRKETFANWRETVGSDFVFSIKGSRFITHIKRLKDCREEVKRFFKAAMVLKRLNLRGGSTSAGKNVILWQLPPNMVFDKLKLKNFLRWLPQGWRQAFEFRNSSWLNDEIYSLLKENNCALVIQDSPDWPTTEVVTADFVYLRFHGRQSLYASCYSDKELDEWSKKVQQWIKKGLDTYGYFNNDAQGYAIQNARALKNLLGNK